MRLRLVYLNFILSQDIKTPEELLNNERLINHLWVELMLNPEMVKVCKSYLNNFVVQESLKYALSWYLGFKWLIPENRPLEELYREAKIKSYPIRDSLYRLYRRNFLKGIIHAGLC